MCFFQILHRRVFFAPRKKSMSSLEMCGNTRPLVLALSKGLHPGLCNGRGIGLQFNFLLSISGSLSSVSVPPEFGARDMKNRCSWEKTNVPKANTGIAERPANFLTAEPPLQSCLRVKKGQSVYIIEIYLQTDTPAMCRLAV